jgi:hypothetical protein
MLRDDGNALSLPLITVRFIFESGVFSRRAAP